MHSVSVIIPAYQSSATIREAIESVFAQTIPVSEIIVIDDGSTDNLRIELNQFIDKIILLRQENLGSASARNNGLRHSSCDIIAFLDADDIWFPQKLALQLPLFDNPLVGAVYGNVSFLHNETIQKKTYFDLYMPQRGNIFLSLFARDYIPMLSVLVRRNILDQIGFFDETIKYCEDYDLLLRISKVSEFDYIQSPIGAYRISPNQISKSVIQAAIYVLRLKESVYQSSLDLFSNIDDDILERGLYNKYFRLALCYMREGKIKEAKQVLDRYRNLHQLSIIYICFWMILMLPIPLLMGVVRMWDKIYQRPELGFV